MAQTTARPISELSDSLVQCSGMDMSVEPTRVGGVAEVKLWDLPTRVFHWSLVAAVATTLATGYLAPEWFLQFHLWAGYAVVALIGFRLVWGVCGSEFSRFDRLLRAAIGIGGHLKSLCQLRPVPHAGHNPSGSAMILALLAALAGLCGTGLIVLGGEEKQGPLAAFVDFRLAEQAGAWHSGLAATVIGLIALHIAGVGLESLLLRVSLPAAMITGRLRLPRAVIPTRQRVSRPWLAAAICAGLSVAAGGGFLFAARLPAHGVPAMPVNAAYQAECGGCHWSFHPSLLPRASWNALMTQLDEHFGEDASLPDATRQAIADYLATYAAEAWDTEAGNRLRLTSPADPLRITKSPFWVAKHRGIADAVFAASPSKRRSNCIACHGDADTGLFADQAIRATPLSKKGFDQ